MHFWNSISTQMIDHEVGNLVSAIKQPINQNKKPRQSEENEMQLKQDASSRMQDQWNSSSRILCSSQCQMQFRNAKNFAIPHSQCENFAMRNFAMRNFRNVNFAMPIFIFALRKSLPLRNSISQTISHCQIHPAKFTGLVILCN